VAISRIRNPNGSISRIEHPDDASQESILSFAASQFNRGQGEEGIVGDVLKAAEVGFRSSELKGRAGIVETAAKVKDMASPTYYTPIPMMGMPTMSARQLEEEGIEAGQPIEEPERDLFKEDALQFAENLRTEANAMSNTVGLDRDFAQSLPGQVLQGIGQYAPMIMYGIVGGVPGVTAQIAGQMDTEALEEAERTVGKKFSEMSDEEKQQANLVRLSQQTIGTGLNMFAFSKLIPTNLKGKVSQFLTNKGTLNRQELTQVVNSLRKDIATSMASEGLTESAEAFSLDLLTKYSGLDSNREVFSAENIRENLYQGLVGSLSAGGTTTISGGIGKGLERIGKIKLPTPETKAVSEEEVSGKKKFRVKYTRTTKEIGQADVVSEGVREFDAKDEDEAKKIVEGSTGKLPGVDLESIIIEEVQPTETKVEPVVQEEVETAVDTETVVQEEVDTEVDTETVVDPVDPQETGAEIPIGVFGDVDLETVEGLTPQQKQKILELRQEANAEARKLFGALDDPTGELDAEAVAEGLKALQEISEDGTVGATSAQKQTLDKIREIERRMSVMIGREYIPRTDADIVGEIERTVINRTQQTGASGALFPNLPIVGATMSPVSSEFDASRVGTAKQGTDAVPRETSQDDNIDTSIVPEAKLKAQMDKINYAHLPKDIKNETNPRAKYEKFVGYMKRNLIALHDKFPEDLRAIATQWYDGARKLTEDLASKYNKTEEQVAGVLAVLSPQKQWFMNLAQGEQVLHILQNYLDTKLEGDAFEVEVESAIKAAKDADLKAHVKKKIAKRGFSKEQAKAVRGRLKERAGFKRRKILNQLKGKTIRQLLELENTTLAGWGIRLLSQREFGRYYNIVNPDGTIMGVDTKKDGTPAVNTWGAIGEIRKAISILENGSLENISENLGQKHKVRNFYNNIVAPNSPYGDATIDTHAVAAGLLMPLGASATEVSHNFGSSIGGAPSIGVNGSYHMYLEAYRRAAREVGIQPRQMQSITWEAVRLLYPSEIRNKESVAKATKIHNNANNEQEARDTILGPAIPRPSWSTAGDSGGVTEIPASIQGFGSDNVLGGDLQFRGRRTQRDAVVGTTQQETQTKAERSVIGSAIAAAQKLAEKLGVKIEESNTINRPAQYNYETQTIQYNPQLLASRGKDFSNAAMREEIIHAAMHQVIMKRNPSLSAKAAFEKAMSSIGSDLTQEQKDLMAAAYGDLGSDLNYGAEYTRFAVQHILDGKTTEGTLFKGKAMDKVKSLIKSVQSYVAKILGPELSDNRDAAFIIADTIRLLKEVDPNKKPAQQKFVAQAESILSGVEAVDAFADNPYATQEQKDKRKSETQRRNIQSVVMTASSFFARIHPQIRNVVSNYFTKTERLQTQAFKQINNFQTRVRGIKNKKDKLKLKQLLYSTPDITTEEGKKLVRQRDALLRKYNIYNDFKLLVQPLLDDLRTKAVTADMPVGYLYEYFPRKVKDGSLEALLDFYGKDIKDDFNSRMAKIDGDRKDNGELRMNTDERAAEFRKYMLEEMYKQNVGERIPGFLKKRGKGMLSEEELQFYEDPEVALGGYINTIIVETGKAELLGNGALRRNKRDMLDGRSTYKVNLRNQNGTLSRLVTELNNRGELSDRQLGDLFFGLDQMFGPSDKTENQYAELGRTLSYGQLLVDPTTTLSQLYDLAFIALDNNLASIVKTIFTKKDFTLLDAGIDPKLLSAEFQSDNVGAKIDMGKIVKAGLGLSGFRSMDALMKETNLTVNYNRYRKVSKLSPNSSKFKKFRSEVEFMVGPQDAERTINDFKNGVYDSPYVRELVVRKLLETQPVNAFEMPMVIQKNPNMRMWYTMKSFILKQGNLINDRMISVIRSKTASGEEKRRAIAALIKLIFTFMMAGVPIDFIKDMIAGRDVYPEDYVDNALLRMFGLSKYNMYEARRHGLAEAFGKAYLLPVPISQVVVMSASLQEGIGKVFTGEFTGTDAGKLIRDLAPMDSVWYYRYGPGFAGPLAGKPMPGVESQRKKRQREAKDSSSIIESLLQFPSGRQRGRRPMIRGNQPIGLDINEVTDIVPFLRNM